MLTPMSSDSRYFYYNIKASNYPVSGKLEFKNTTSEFTPRNGLAGMDWGRGVWPYHTFWIWARGQGRLPHNSNRFSLNLGRGFQDFNTSVASEDAFFINDNIYKLNAAEIEYDENNLLNPWKFSCTKKNKNFRECDITFKPSAKNTKETNLVFIKTNLQVVYGTFEGWVTDRNGHKTTFTDIDAVVELHRARW